MRFMMLIKSDPTTEAGVLPDEAMLSEMGKYNQALVEAGILLGGEGLQASSKGARVRFTSGKWRVLDGPFAEAKELVAGFWLIQVGSREEAIAWAKRAPDMEGEIEIRELYEMSDFPEDPSEKPDGWREQEQRFRDATEGEKGRKIERKPGTKRFMALLKSDRHTESGDLPSQEILEEMSALMQKLVESGDLLGGEGLKPSSKGARVFFSGSKRTVVDGPFAESKELVAGYTLVQAKSKQEAVDHAKAWLAVHLKGSGLGEGEIEVRQVFDLEDFPVGDAEKPDGWRKQEQEFRDRTGQ